MTEVIAPAHLYTESHCMMNDPFGLLWVIPTGQITF